MSQTMIPGRPGALPPALLLSRLRGDTAERPVVDPGFAGGLRDWLEDALSDPAAKLDPGVGPVRVTKESLSRVLLCEAHALSRADAMRTITFELVRGALADSLFRLWVTVGRIDDPLDDSLLAVAACGDEAVTSFVSELDPADRARLSRELDLHAETIVSTWPVPSGPWFGRTQERIEVPLAGGAIVLAGVVDLAFGAPSSGRASVCLVEAKSGPRRLEHRADLHYYALLETLRGGAPPFRIATYYSLTGELDAEAVGEEILRGAVLRLIDGATRLCALAAGAQAQRTANPACEWCALSPSCDVGRARVRLGSAHGPVEASAGQDPWSKYDFGWDADEI